MKRTLAILGVSSVLIVFACSASAAWAVVCGDSAGPGGTDIPCACGDTATTNTVLDATDPVTTTVCPCNGLVVQSGVTLDLGGRTITGSGVCVGIDIGGAVAGFDVVVRNGNVVRFGTGVLAFGEAHDNRVHDLVLTEHSERGIFLLGPGSVVEDCVVARTGGPAIELSIGNDPPGGGVVQRCRVEDTAGTGIAVGGRLGVVQGNVVRRSEGRGIAVGGEANTVTLNRAEQNVQGGIFVAGGPPELGVTSVTRNVALRNLGTGVAVVGDEIVIDRNQAKYNGADGFQIAGSANTVTLNIAVDNRENGFFVDAPESAFDRNTASYNDGRGFVDITGGATSTYSANRCTGNGLGASSPPGLCF